MPGGSKQKQTQSTPLGEEKRRWGREREGKFGKIPSYWRQGMGSRAWRDFSRVGREVGVGGTTPGHCGAVGGTLEGTVGSQGSLAEGICFPLLSGCDWMIRGGIMPRY